MRIESTLGLILECLVLYTGVLVWLYSTCMDALEKYFSFGPEHQIVRGTVFILIVSMFSTTIKIPFEIYRLLRIDASYQSQVASDHMKYWIADQLKAFVFSLALGIPVCVLLQSVNVNPDHRHYVGDTRMERTVSVAVDMSFCFCNCCVLL